MHRGGMWQDPAQHTCAQHASGQVAQNKGKHVVRGVRYTAAIANLAKLGDRKKKKNGNRKSSRTTWLRLARTVEARQSFTLGFFFFLKLPDDHLVTGKFPVRETAALLLALATRVIRQ